MASGKLSDQLKHLILQPSIRHSQSSLGPLIQVVHSEGDTPRVSFDSKSPDENNNNCPDDGDCGDDDDGPPPIIFPAKTTATQTLSSPSVCDGQFNIDSPSLGEQLLAEATLARENQLRLREQKVRLRAKKSNFGLKKGFLNSSSSKREIKKMDNGVGKAYKKSPMLSDKKYPGDAVVEEQKGDRKNNLIYELDSHGNMIPSPCSGQQSPSNDIHGPLHLPEVHSSMMSDLQTNSAQWATSDLLDTITKSHPKLARGMHDPRYTAALRNMQTKPKETLELLKATSPDIVEWLMEFCSVMGEHFIRMGEERDGKGGGAIDGEEEGGAKVREMGPLEKKALERHHEMQMDDNAAQNVRNASSPSNEMDDQVSTILANDELRCILMDPVMQGIMEECSTGNKLRYYMTHEEIGPKLRKLMDVGLIQLA